LINDMYVFPAVFDYAADGISIVFPDLPGCLPCAHSTDEAIKNAREALLLHLCSMRIDNEKIPWPSDALAIILEPGQSIFMIEADLSACRNANSQV
jgi:predicted RNase H-like HicB family nuclease